MSNKYTATVDVQLGEKTYKLNYNYEAISAVISKMGKDILNTLYEVTPAELAFILCAGLKGQISEAEIMEISPPIFAACRKIDEALGFAYFGPDGPPKKAEDTKKNPDQTKTK